MKFLIWLYTYYDTGEKIAYRTFKECTFPLMVRYRNNSYYKNKWYKWYLDYSYEKKAREF